jgi:hypothetical protein
LTPGTRAELLQLLDEELDEIRDLLAQLPVSAERLARLLVDLREAREATEGL